VGTLGGGAARQEGEAIGGSDPGPSLPVSVSLLL
jgi:hypothetical protein